jgi:hypothetical protein
LSSAGRECASTSGTPCRDRLRAFRRAARRRDRFPPDLVKGRRCERSRAPSIDECPHRPAALPLRRKRRPSSVSPPPVPGLCRPRPGFRRSFAAPLPREEVARPRPLPCALHARALLATRRSSTSAIVTIRKHDRRTSKPDAHGGRSAFTEPSPAASVRISTGPRRFPDTIPPKRSRVVTGQGPFDS